VSPKSGIQTVPGTPRRSSQHFAKRTHFRRQAPTWGLWRPLALTCGDTTRPPAQTLAAGFREHPTQLTTHHGMFVKEHTPSVHESALSDVAASSMLVCRPMETKPPAQRAGGFLLTTLFQSPCARQCVALRQANEGPIDVGRRVVPVVALRLKRRCGTWAQIVDVGARCLETSQSVPPHHHPTKVQAVEQDGVCG
jgi:hypothetical protein